MARSAERREKKVKLLFYISKASNKKRIGPLLAVTAPATKGLRYYLANRTASIDVKLTTYKTSLEAWTEKAQAATLTLVATSPFKNCSPFTLPSLKLAVPLPPTSLPTASFSL
jgi:hypothetical protein